MAEAKVRAPKDGADHFHRWLIDEPNGPVSGGVCKVCGIQKEFKNWWYITSGRTLRASSINASPF